jgi:hypothetical protein
MAMGLSNAERQERWRAKHATEVEELRKAADPTVARELAGARKEITALRNENFELKSSLSLVGDVLAHRTGALTRAEFLILLSCLHPDSRNSVSEKKLGDAFRLLDRLRYVLCNEQEMPFPKGHRVTQEELAMRKQYVAAKKAAEAGDRREARRKAKSG